MDKRTQVLAKVVLSLEADAEAGVDDEGIELYNDNRNIHEWKPILIDYVKNFCSIKEIPLYINYHIPEIKEAALERLQKGI